MTVTPSEVLAGEVVRWRMEPKADSGWHIVEVEDDHGERHSVTGCSLPRVGMRVQLHGQWETHERFGPQFHCRSVASARPPLNPEGVARWMRERCDGIGPKRAAELLAAFGNDAQRLWTAVESGLASAPEVACVTWLTPEIATGVSEAFTVEGAAGEYNALLHGWGMTQRQISKVKRHWELAEATQLLTRNPYLLADHIDGFGFNRADMVAKKLGIGHNDDVRVRAALLHFIDQAANEGHVFVDEPVMKRIARETRLPVERLLDGVRALKTGGRLIVEDGARVYLPELHNAETNVALDISSRFGADGVDHRAADEGVGDELRVVESDGGTTQDPWQQLAIRAVCDMNLPIVFITGGPGTGKTTVLKQALAELRARGIRTALAAPTGKAAKRMTEATGQRALTLHALLGYRPTRTVDCEVCRAAESEFDFGVMNSSDPRVIVVDEASMVDIRLWEALAQAANGRARLVFVGDANQLPPVGPGQPFRDALEVAPSACVVRLRTVFRTKGEWVKVAAPQILAGQMPNILFPAPGLLYIASERADYVVPSVLQLVQGAFDGPHFNAGNAAALGHMPILSPQRTGLAGVSAINRALHDLLNVGDVDDPYVELEDDNTLRLGSWVMFQKNDTKRRICNGDTGYVTAVDGKLKTLAVEVEGGATGASGENSHIVSFTYGEAREHLKLAYSSTVHKSQGSEYPWVVVVCHSTHRRMLTRRLLYTAVTRAKEGVVLIGDSDGIEHAVENAREVQRCTWLTTRITNRF